MNDLFGEPVQERLPVVPGASKKRKDPIPAGYAATPGTGPAGETCGSCAHRRVISCAKRYHKCGLMQRIWTGGRKTDILVRSPACAKWEAKP